jgi:Uma2 family endonuclease
MASARAPSPTSTPVLDKPLPRATLDDLYREEGKAELIGGRIVRYMGTGYKPNQVAKRIVRSLDDFSEVSGSGNVGTDGLVYAVPELLSGRESFSPDASFYTGPLPTNLMRFIEGPPTLAVEVRSENDYGRAAERDMALKRADYFAAGSLVVWDVDPIAECIHVYRGPADEPEVTYRRGDTAEAEPAVPSWTVSLDWIFS